MLLLFLAGVPVNVLGVGVGKLFDTYLTCIYISSLHRHIIAYLSSSLSSHS